MRSKFIILLFIITLHVAQEDNYLREVDPFLFVKNGKPVQNIFSGGVNNPEFQFVDIDDDNDLDLFILSSDGSFVWFENTGSSANFEFSLRIDSLYGLKLHDWFYFVDIDDDSDYDVFTGKRGSKVTYYENVGTPTNPNFELKIDTVRNVLGNDIIGETGSNPALIDIDNDGDNDFISGNFSGTAYFYKNVGTTQEFLFDTLDSKWQNLQVGGGKLAGSQLHGASSIDFADIDGDNDLDLFWGDFFNTSLYLIRNSGTSEVPKYSIESSYYPLNDDSIATRGFNMPRLVDIDGDGNLDLFSSVLFNDITEKSTIAYRKNNGVNDFQLITNDFLNSLDVGARSTPQLIDIDDDGDLDLFIGSENIDGGTIHFYENVGSASNPTFKYATDQYFQITGELSLSPSFGDLDGDGDYDLLVADSFNGIDYYENTGDRLNPNFEFVEKLKTTSGENLNPGVYAKINLIDADDDGDLDIIAGNFNGAVKFYRNTGTESNFIFSLDENYLSIIKQQSYSYPTLFDYDNDGVNELFVGTDDGKLSLYENTSNESPNFQLINNNFLNTHFGAEPNIVFAEIDGDGDNDLFIGNIKGGLYFYRNLTVSSVDEEKLLNEYKLGITAYPNPFNSIVNLEVRVPKNTFYSLKIFNILGEEVLLLFSGASIGETQSFTWNTNEISYQLATGIYIVVLQTPIGIKSLPIQYLK